MPETVHARPLTARATNQFLESLLAAHRALVEAEIRCFYTESLSPEGTSTEQAEAEFSGAKANRG